MQIETEFGERGFVICRMPQEKVVTVGGPLQGETLEKIRRGVPGIARTDLVGRVGDDQVEAFADHRLEQVAESDVGFGPEVVSCAPSGAGIDVGRGDLCAKVNHDRRQEAGTRSQVEDPLVTDVEFVEDVGQCASEGFAGQLRNRIEDTSGNPKFVCLDGDRPISQRSEHGRRVSRRS